MFSTKHLEKEFGKVCAKNEVLVFVPHWVANEKGHFYEFFKTFLFSAFCTTNSSFYLFGKYIFPP